MEEEGRRLGCSTATCPSKPTIRIEDMNATKAKINKKEINFRTELHKYMVLAHDCLAIKFIEKENLSQENGSCKDQSNDLKIPKTECNAQNARKAEVIKEKNKSKHYTILPQCISPERDSEEHEYEKLKSVGHTERNLAQDANQGRPKLPKNSDQTLHGYFLYKDFLDVNLGNYWNAAVEEAFRNIYYKGYIVPCVVLVGCELPKYLRILKTSWARRMLKSPKHYEIEFLGEIEEFIADPIQRSYFVPLSDSLCWVINEITGSGQEAFVDEILVAMESYFPHMVLPSRDLIYRTLEQLIKDKKVYQTAEGYFIVTPEVYKYIAASDYKDQGQFPRSLNFLAVEKLSNVERPNICSALRHQRHDLDVMPSESHNLNVSSSGNQCSVSGKGALLMPIETNKSGVKLDIPSNLSKKRYSLKRRLSFKRDKKKWKHYTNEKHKERALKSDDLIPSVNSLSITGGDSSTLSSMASSSATEGLSKNSRSKSLPLSTMSGARESSLLKKLISFHGRREKDRKKTENGKHEKDCRSFGSSQFPERASGPTCSMSTQTSFSIENLYFGKDAFSYDSSSMKNVCVKTEANSKDISMITSKNNSCASPSSNNCLLHPEESDSGRCTASSSDIEPTTSKSTTFPFDQDEPKSNSCDETRNKLSNGGGAMKMDGHDYESIGSGLFENLESHGENFQSSPCPTSVSQKSSNFFILRENAHNVHQECRRRHASAGSLNSWNSSLYPTRDALFSSCKESQQQPARTRNALPNERNKLSQNVSREQYNSKKSKSNRHCRNCTCNSKFEPKLSEPSQNASSNLQLEVILPMEKLINAALSEGNTLKMKNDVSSDKKKTNENSENEFPTDSISHSFVNDLFSISSTGYHNGEGLTSKIEIRSRPQNISAEPVSFNSRQKCRESEII